MLQTFSKIYLLCALILIMDSCNDAELAGPVLQSATDKVNILTEDLNVSCSSDDDPFFGCYFNASFPFYQAAEVKDLVELSFGMANEKPSIINPSYRSLYGLLTYEDALFTSFMNTSITQSNFDTITTDYLIRELVPSDYALEISGKMNCIFFRSANNNYGLIRISSVTGAGSGLNPLRVSFDVKFVDAVQ